MIGDTTTGQFSSEAGNAVLSNDRQDWEGEEGQQGAIRRKVCGYLDALKFVLRVFSYVRVDCWSRKRFLLWLNVMRQQLFALFSG